MFELQTKIKRQIEIIGLCLSEKSNKICISDLSDYFNVDNVTIKRDLKDLRFYGIDIHSEKKRGVYISAKLDAPKIKEIILHYVGLCYSGNIFDKSTLLLVEKHNTNALSHLIMLQICIDRNLESKIWYNKNDELIEERIIRPLLIFHSEGSWRVLSQEGNSVKQFHFDKITKVKATEKNFPRMSSEKFESMFNYSWGSWIGNEKHKVKLRFSKEWADRIKPRMWTPDQKITDNTDGSFIFEVTVNTLREIASWIVSRGKGCIVMEPEELKQLVIDIAKETLNNYEE